MSTRSLRKRTSNSPAVEIKLRKIVPVIPMGDGEKEQLVEDLTSMGCPGFLSKPWGFREETMVRELIAGPSNEFDGQLRGRPEQWTEETWRDVYGFRSGGQGMAGRKEDYYRGKFRGVVNPKDGYAVEDCIDARHRRLLAFLIPILYPDKPTRVTITLGNLIFGALTGKRRVDWGRIIFDLVAQLASRVGKSRATPISPYLFHLYHANELLSVTEQKTWEQLELLLSYGESGTDDEVESESGSEPESEGEEDPPQPPPKRCKTKSTSKSPTEGRGKGPAPVSPEREAQPEPAGPSEKKMVNAFDALLETLKVAKEEFETSGMAIHAIKKLVGAKPDLKLADLVTTVAECIRDPVEQAKQESHIRFLKGEIERMCMEVVRARDEGNRQRQMNCEIVRVAEKVRSTLGQPGDAVAKARLFDEKVHEDKKLSGSRIVRILADYSYQIEELLKTVRGLASRIEDLSGQSTVSPSKGFRLSDLSLPDEFPDIPLTGDPKFATPESRRAEGERARDLASAFDNIASGSKSPSIGPRVNL